MQPHVDGRPGAWSARDRERAVRQLHALVHPGEAEALARRVGIEARAVVADGDSTPSSRAAHADRHVARAGVLDDVRQRLLHDPVDGRLESRGPGTRRVAPSARSSVDGRSRAVAARDALARGLERGRQAELVERRRAQVGDQRAQVCDLARRSARRASSTPRRPARVAAAARAGEQHAQPAELCSVSSCSSRAQRRARPRRRPRCCAAAPRRSAVCAVATAVAALAANACSRPARRRSNGRPSPSRSNATSTPSGGRGTTAARAARSCASATPSCSARPARRGAGRRCESRGGDACARPHSREARVDSAIGIAPPARSAEPRRRARRLTSSSPSTQQDQQRARARQRAPALDDQLQHAVEARLAAERAA